VGNITTLAVTTVAPTAIRATQWGKAVEIQESPAVAGFPTTDLLVFKGSATSTPRRITQGNTYNFENQGGGNGAGFGPGDIIGWVQAVTVGTTIVVDEQGV
jgi:hypothetical protein